MRYSPEGADDIHDCVVMIYQACGLDKKILVPKNEDFLALGYSPTAKIPTLAAASRVGVALRVECEPIPFAKRMGRFVNPRDAIKKTGGHKTL